MAFMSKVIPLAILVLGLASNLDGQAGKLTPERIALQTLRVINTTENEVRQRTGKYLEAVQLFRAPEFARLIESFGLKEYLQLSAAAADIVPAFTTILRLGDRGDTYVVLLSNKDTGFAYKSDQDGVILVGTAVDPSAKPSIDPAYFRGGPMVKPTNGG